MSLTQRPPLKFFVHGCVEPNPLTFRTLQDSPFPTMLMCIVFILLSQDLNLTHLTLLLSLCVGWCMEKRPVLCCGNFFSCCWCYCGQRWVWIESGGQDLERVVSNSCRETDRDCGCRLQLPARAKLRYTPGRFCCWWPAWFDFGPVQSTSSWGNDVTRWRLDSDWNLVDAFNQVKSRQKRQGE